MGMMALSGVVVNDSIILVTAIRKLGESLPVSEAIVRAAEQRFRPILLTSATTMFGLLPLLLEVSAQAQWIKPIVVSLAFGVLFSAAITLLLVPAIYIVLENLRDRYVASEKRIYEGGTPPRPRHADHLTVRNA